MQSWNSYAKIVTALFVIANPVGVIPTFISLTSGYKVTDKRRTSQVTAATVFIVLVAAAILGDRMLHFFGISVASFRVGGGILILLMAIGMLGAKPSSAHYTPEEAEAPSGKDSVAVVPLAIPLVAGPGAISTMIIYANHAATWYDTAFLFLASLFVAASVWVALRLADPISTVL
ncbi:MAG TPA: NAAT family transporter, partial [Candidatus Sulfotelmatobacter sp.]|nr:NAAT family transporter [Candidatus Sulfotelmatobacter sp.]